MKERPAVPVSTSNHAIPVDPRPVTGEALPLDLMNTRWVDPEGSHDLLETLDGLSIWLASAGFADQVEADSETLHTLLTTRDALHSLVSDDSDGESARSVLNETLAHGSIRRFLGPDGPTSKVEVVPSFWLPAWAAAETYLRLLDEAPERISKCANPGCILHFYDLTRDCTRHWCSVTGCGGRALRRVATLVARGASPGETFSAVAEELGCLFEADYATIQRYEPDDTVTVVGHWNDPESVQIRPPLDGHWRNNQDALNATILRTGLPTRLTPSNDIPPSEIGSWLQENHIQYALGCPVVIEGYTWGALNVYYLTMDPAPTAGETRMAEFAEEIGLALSETRNRAELIASRARVVSVSDETRRSIERNLHDSVQQRLVSLGLEVVNLKATVPAGNDALQKQLSHLIDGLSGAGEELREISRGLHPSLLRNGLVPALRGLARRSAIPAELTLGACRRLPEGLEVAIYYVVSEALTNTAKHAQASSVSIALDMDADTARLSVWDDGVGGANFGSGSGLIGLTDRVESLGGKIHIASPAGNGTSLRVELPIKDTHQPEAGHSR
jgi:signal transduction histidine kinase/predicted RNA-binding Zn ribbon-like protein